MALQLLCLVPRLCAASVYSQDCILSGAIFGPEMTNPRISNFSWGPGGGGGGGGGGGMSPDPPSWCVLMQALFHCNCSMG